MPLLGLAFDNLDVTTVVERMLARRTDAPFSYVVTPNADHIARLRRIPKLSTAYDPALFCLLDSQMIGNTARLLRLRQPPVVTGVALTAALLDRLDGRRVAVIGLGRPEMAFLRVRYPAIEFLHHLPPMGLLGDPLGFRRARDFAVQASAPFVFIALGSPLQELLAYAISQQRSGTGIGLCIGAGLRYRAGFIKRAPVWMQRAGLEWLFRLCHEPTRLAGRYLIRDPVVMLALAREAWRRGAR